MIQYRVYLSDIFYVMHDYIFIILIISMQYSWKCSSFILGKWTFRFYFRYCYRLMLFTLKDIYSFSATQVLQTKILLRYYCAVHRQLKQQLKWRFVNEFIALFDIIRTVKRCRITPKYLKRTSVLKIENLNKLCCILKNVRRASKRFVLWRSNEKTLVSNT